MANLLNDHMADFVPHPTILQLKARTLRNESTPLRGRPPPPARLKKSGDSEMSPLIDLYNKFNGDLDKIFEQLGEDPNKAKKYPPTDAEDFAHKYITGNFTYVSNLEEIRGRAIGRAGGDKEVETVLEEYTPQEVPEEMLEEKAVHAIDVLKAMFPDVEEETIEHVFESAHGSLEDAAFMKILQAFTRNITGESSEATATLSFSEQPPIESSRDADVGVLVEKTVEEMSVRQLLKVANEEGVDVSKCIEKSELVNVINEHRKG